jgi:phospholipase C
MTTERIFGCKMGVTPGTPCTEPASVTGTPTMAGFVQSARWLGEDGVNEMSMWPPEKVPIITTLAKQFALFDNLFVDYPGPTFPNRQFVVSGTAHGEQNDEVPPAGFPQKTIFRLIEENNQTWRVYYEDSLAWCIFNNDLRRPEAAPFLRNMSEFYADAAAGTLPNFAFIEPRIAASANASHLPSFGLPNHQHPTASVLEGERLMKNVYEGAPPPPKKKK